MLNKNYLRSLLCFTATAAISSAAAAAFTVTNLNDSGTGSYRAAVTSGNASAGSTIVFDVGGTITLNSPITPIESNITQINSNGFNVTFAGQGANSAFYVYSGNSGSPGHPGLFINNSSSGSFTASTASVGGDGVFGAGGALGAGGGLFIAPGSVVTIKAMAFTGCLAQGGNGTIPQTTAGPGGGGGMLGQNGTTSSPAGNGGGLDGIGGGGAGSDPTGSPGQFGAGGGGGANGIGGAGGFGGGGGAGDYHGVAASGGFGGGGATTDDHSGKGGFGAGNGDFRDRFGGGGAGLGGAIFVGNGATLNIQDPISFSSNSVGGGTGGHDGTGLGSDIFLMSAGQINFDFTNSSTIATISTNIESDQGAGGGSTATGGITMGGTGTLVLGGVNTYTGNTILGGSGTIQVSQGSNLGSSTVPFIFNNNMGVLEFTQSGFTTSRPLTLSTSGNLQLDVGTTTWAGLIAGPGGLLTTGPGTLRLTNLSNSYQGGTTIADGSTVAVTSDEELGLVSGGLIFIDGTLHIMNTFVYESVRTMDMLATATIQVDDAINAFIGGQFSGAGQLNLVGPSKSGALNFFALDSHTGSIDATGIVVIPSNGTLNTSASLAVEAQGNFTNDGHISIPTTVSGYYQGTGTTGLLTVASGGSLQPGAPFGTLTSNNTLTYQAGSTHVANFNNTESNLLNQTAGTVTINPGSTLELFPINFTSAQPKYVLINSTNPIVGQFSTLVNPLTRYQWLVEYNADPTVALVLLDVLPFSAFVSGNAKAAATCFDTMIASPNACIAQVLQILDQQTPSQMQKSFNEMQPANFNNIAFAEENVAERIRQIYTTHFYEQRVASCPEPGAWRLWIAPFIERVRQHGNTSLPGYKEQFSGFSAAADYQWQKHWAFTGGFSFASSKMAVPNGKAHAEFVTYAGSLATAWTDTHWYADAVLGYLFSPVRAKRKMHFAVDTFALDASFKAKAKHSEDSNQILSHLGGGYNFKIHSGTRNTVNIYPFANLDYIWMNNSGYTEHGAHCMDLKVKSKQYDYLRPEGGLGLGYVGCLKDLNVMFDTTVSYVHEFRFMGKKTKAHFTGNSCTMDVTGLKPANNLVSPTARLRLSSNDASGYSFSIGYHGEYGKHFALNAGEAEIRKAF